MVGHLVRQLKPRTIALESVFDNNVAARQKVERRIHRCPRDLNLRAPHGKIKFVCAEVMLLFQDTVQHKVPFLCVAVLFFFQKFRNCSLMRTESTVLGLPFRIGREGKTMLMVMVLLREREKSKYKIIKILCKSEI